MSDFDVPNQPRVTRREAFRSALTAGVAAAVAPKIGAAAFNKNRYKLFARSAEEYPARVVELVGRSTAIDMLSPFALSQTRSAELLLDPKSFTAAEIEERRASGIRVFHIAIGNGGPDVHIESIKFFGLWNGFIAYHGQNLMRVDRAASFDELKGNGKIGVVLGLQNSEHFRGSDDVDFFYSLGQRVSQLTYNERNFIGNGSTERRDDGISDFGVAIIERMNKVGMAVDVSHCGDRTTLDAFEFSKKPVLITHANCRALDNHPRCKTDEAIRKMAATGGAMGITGVRMFVKADEPTTIEDVLNHFDHVIKLTSVEHVGVGSDSDLHGYDAMPAKENKQLRAAYKGTYAFRERIDIDGLNQPKRIFDLTAGLIRRGYNDADIELILGGNFKRVLSQIWVA